MAKRKNKRMIIDSIKRYVRELRNSNIKVVSAYLFGSYATGTANEWSDIDVALLTNRFIGDAFDFKFLLMQIARKINYNIEPHPFLVSDFKKSNPFAVEIIETGKRIV